MINRFSIDETVLGDGRVFVIAEMSANHGKDLDVALQTVEAAAWAGVDAIKLQTVDPGLITLDCDDACFQVPPDTLWAGQTLYQLEVATFLPREWHLPIFAKARSLGLACFSSPFDLTAVDFLETLDSPAYKIASFEITDLALIRKVAETGKPVMISTGIATQDDIELAVKCCQDAGNRKIALLKCTSAYPTPLDQVDLNSMSALGQRYGCLFGLSDHTLGDSVAVGATALGASIIEKHIILNDRIESADSSFSMQPKEFKEMVRRIRDLEAALGSSGWRMSPGMLSGRKLARSLFVVEEVKAGEILTADNVRSIRPGDGLAPKHLASVLGKVAAIDIARGTPLSWGLVRG
jgi:pseudaminic acid synthase